jgi:hypothetical protein
MISRLSYGWWVAAAAFFTLLIAVGLPFYGLPFFYDYMQHDQRHRRGDHPGSPHWRLDHPTI